MTEPDQSVTTHEQIELGADGSETHTLDTTVEPAEEGTDDQS